MIYPVFKLMRKGWRLVTDRRYKKGAVLDGRYLVMAVLGFGSYGKTYLCEDLSDGKRCVVKQMTKSKNKAFIQNQYEQETKILGQLDHPSIPSLYDCFSFQQTRFFSMQYMEGRSLEDVIFVDGCKFDEKESLLLLEEIVKVLDYIHSEGIVHGDVRIPNVILNGSTPSIIDFGLAKRYDSFFGSSKESIRKEDFFDAGDLLLYLLYSTYTPGAGKSRPWTEELTLEPATRLLLKRLLGMGKPYVHTEEVLADIRQAKDQLN